MDFRVRLALCSAAASLTVSAHTLKAQDRPVMPPAHLPRKVVSIDPAERVRALALHSPEVNPDRTATFRLQNATAKAVSLELETFADPMPMQRDENGLWTITTEPLAPEYYGYHFIVDGEKIMDPHNAVVRRNRMSPSSIVFVPGTPAREWEPSTVPHGDLTRMLYTTKLAPAEEPGLHERELIVYTPPGYDAKRKQTYPVLYLLNGYSDSAIAWTDAGQANQILDTLIAQGKLQPTVVVMPEAYGDLRMISEGWGVWTPPYTRPLENQRIFTDMMLREIIPTAEARFHIARDPAHRALAGLSMGGGETIFTGLNHPETFGYVGAFSSAIVSPITAAQARPGGMDAAAYAAAFQGIVPNSATQAPFRLFWISCGTEDGLITANRAFGAWAKQNIKGNVSVNTTPGMHTWPVWRENLITFSQLMFK